MYLKAKKNKLFFLFCTTKTSFFLIHTVITYTVIIMQTFRIHVKSRMRHERYHKRIDIQIGFAS